MRRQRRILNYYVERVLVSYLDKIQQCNNMRTDVFTPLLVADRQVGWIRDDYRDSLRQFPEVFEFDEGAIHLQTPQDDQQLRTGVMQGVIDTLILDGVLPRPYGEVYPVTASHKGSAEFLIDRGLSSCFGTRTFGQHLNGYVVKNGDLLMWIARRAMDRGYEPGKLDQLVAGGFPHGVSAEDNMRKECMEEAGMVAELADKAVAVGAITCRYEVPRGVKPETLYCYDLILPDDFQPVCTDGEVDEFMLMPVEEVAEIVRDTDDFKLNCNLVVIDFLIRHGYLMPEDRDYDLLVAGLHQ